jgi:hypothetical protein
MMMMSFICSCHYINRGVVTIKTIKRNLHLADIGPAPRPHPQIHSMRRVIHGES